MFKCFAHFLSIYLLDKSFEAENSLKPSNEAKAGKLL